MGVAPLFPWERGATPIEIPLYQFGYSKDVLSYIEALTIFKEHGLVPSRKQLEHAVCNYTLEKFKFVLSLNPELKSDESVLMLAVLNVNLEITSYLLETMKPDLGLLKQSLKRALIPYKHDEACQILIMLLQKGFDPKECLPFLNTPLAHELGRGVLNDFAEQCDVVNFAELLKDVTPELLTLQIALRKAVLERNTQAFEIIKLLVCKPWKMKMRGVKEGIEWLGFNSDEKNNFHCYY